jgi:hypothetical protein
MGFRRFLEHFAFAACLQDGHLTDICVVCVFVVCGETDPHPPSEFVKVRPLPGWPPPFYG